jgi:hypothetical protein
MADSERLASWTSLLVGFILLVAVAVLTMEFAPIATCPGLGKEFLAEVGVEGAHRLLKCPECDGSGRVSLLKRWSYQGEDPFRRKR